MLIIGSCAIKYWYIDFPREPKDLDVIRQYDGENFFFNIFYQDFHSPKKLNILKILSY